MGATSGDFGLIVCRDTPRTCPLCWTHEKIRRRQQGRLQLAEEEMRQRHGWHWRVSIPREQWVYQCDQCEAGHGTYAEIERKRPLVSNQVKNMLLAGQAVICGHWEHVDPLDGESDTNPRIALLTPSGTSTFDWALWRDEQLKFVPVASGLDIEKSIYGQFDPLFLGMLEAHRWVREVTFSQTS